ncbi:MAG TPA: DNA replication/repair protein RecF [Marmoricola sp.]
MYVDHLTLRDFRSWPELELDLGSGITALVGRNGQGKTNIVEAIDYLSRLSSHRVVADAPLVRQGASQAIVRAAAVRDERRAVLEIEINPGRSNRARINSSPLPKARELLGVLRSVVFAPDDLALVKGDPGDRRRYLDDLLIQRTPRFAGVRADYDRVLKQRNSLLRSASVARGSREAALATLEVWDERLVDIGAQIAAARIGLVADLGPVLGKAYEAVARGAHRDDATVAYQCSFAAELSTDHDALVAQFRTKLAERQKDELDRGITLAGPHRDELLCSLGELPVKGYSSHGESWSFALALRLGSYDLLRAPDIGEAEDPVLILDDVFAELDAGRREQLAEMIIGAEQVLITAAVADDVPPQLRERRYSVADGEVRRD